MKFVDEAIIVVEAGKGGSGCLSFRREKYIPFGGPDGGDGGDGGSIFLRADPHVNTLAMFRYKKRHVARNGQPGMGQLRRGKSGEDLIISVPLGTLVYDHQTDEFLGDLVHSEQKLCVAQGGFHGLGNARYKSSTQRAPRQTSPGTPGEMRELRLELNVLADVGLCGLPNAGKSTLIRDVSNASPKVADYPFTTCVPHLGVVTLDQLQAFVIADIPGLIAGASSGVGLGVQFLKHLQRTRLLLHVIDISASGGVEEVINNISIIETELKQYSAELAQKPRWLVFNKIDLLDENEWQKCCEAVVSAIHWNGPIFKISAMCSLGTRELCQEILVYLQ